MSRSFDTIDRTKLINMIKSMPGIRSDDCKLIRVLLSNTTLRVSFNGVMTDPFVSTIGSPQGDGLSPILFAIYLETALRALEQKTPSRPDVDLNLPS